MKKKKTQASAFNKYLLIGLSVFCILMMTLSVVSEKTKGPFKMIAEVTVVPLQKGINHIGSWMGDMKDNFQTLKEVRAENKKLQEQVDSLVIENNNLQQERYELERLQELYQLDQSYSDYKKTAAQLAYLEKLWETKPMLIEKMPSTRNAFINMLLQDYLEIAIKVIWIIYAS